MIRARTLALLLTSALVCGAAGCDSVSRPSEADVRRCVQADASGEISQVEFGNTTTSQGGMIELAMGAPKDTKIFPVNIHRPYGGSTTVMTYWTFKDSFGELKCPRAPGAERRTYQTPAQAAQEAEQRRLAAQQQAERERLQAEQQRAQAEQQRVQAEAQRLADERARKEAPAKLRALLTNRPVLDGTYATGYGPTKITLRVVSFNSSTGSVSAEVQYKDALKRAEGSVSGDMLNITVLAISDSKPWVIWKLRYDGIAGKLVGQWNNVGENDSSPISFDLK